MTQEASQAAPLHAPVLPTEVLECLAPRPGEIVVDATVGAGGHAWLLASGLGTQGRFFGFDVDEAALQIAGRRLADCACKVALLRRNFTELAEALREQGVMGVDVLLADLGVSSMQLADAGRGFSFNADGPLDMRMDDRLPRRAADLVNTLREGELSDLIWNLSQERASRRIAQRICSVRREARITTTGQLVDIICRATGTKPRAHPGKIHPATRTFQALRVAVNDELGALRGLLEQAPGLLNPGGRVGIIAFHSLEDAVVKKDFRRRKEEGVYELVNKRPIVAGEEERRANPRSRSAKFRAARRTQPGECTSKEVGAYGA